MYLYIEVKQIMRVQTNNGFIHIHNPEVRLRLTLILSKFKVLQIQFKASVNNT